MKKIILPFLFLLLFTNKSNANQWITSFKEAQKLSIATNKFILVDFWATWCGPCKRMDSESWSDTEVQGLMNNFIPLKLDIDNERILSRKYAVRSIPNIFIIDPNGEIVFQKMSYMSKNEVKNLLNKYAVNTGLLQTDFSKYYKNKTGDIALSIATKYFDYSLYIDKELRSNFLKLGSKYLKNAQQFFKKEGDKKRDAQKIDLLENVYRKMLQGNYEKSLKILKTKFTEATIEEKNKPLFDFLNFTLYNKLEDKEQAKIWYQKLKKHKEAKMFLLKSRKV